MAAGDARRWLPEFFGVEMAGGGRRAGAGRKPSGAKQAREWFRDIVCDPVRRQKFLAALDAQLEAGETAAYFKAMEHGFGRPPQSLNVTGGLSVNGGIFKAEFADGTQVYPDSPAPAGLPN